MFAFSQNESLRGRNSLLSSVYRSGVRDPVICEVGTPGAADILSVAIPALLCLATLPLLFSEISLSEALSGSLVGRLVLSLTGRGPEKLNMSRRLGRSNIAFIIGLLSAC